IGMDDTFVLLAAWRRTDLKKPVRERMAETYSEAAVSITITSLTNFLSFLIGVLTPFPAVQIFCIYTAVAVLFTYLWHITFFGGCMAICGYAERRNLHSVFCVPATPRSVAISGNKSVLFRLLCTGGINKDDPDNLMDNREHTLMVFFRDSLGKALSYMPTKILIIMCFLVYLIIGIWGCTQVKEGLERNKLSQYDSYSVTYYRMDDLYFRKYPFRIQVVVADELNYADPKIQEAMENMLQKFENEEFSAGSSLTESWLRAYLQFQKDGRSFFLLDGFNLTKKEDFIEALRSVFLRLPQVGTFKKDILFNEDGTSIVSSRFLIQTKDVRNANQEKAMVIKLREIADNSPFNVTVYQQFFIFWDQFILVRETSIQAISVAAAVMMVILLIFIPKPICALWVAFSIISIEIGVIGYMTLWNVNLDSISMINLIMCIGFSVDYSAHISYAYISSERKTADDRIRSALHSLGMPILQGSLSTILGIISLSFAPSYIFLAFFKTIFLVILFGALHGLLLLPILLSISDQCCSSKKDDIPLYHPQKSGSSVVPIAGNGNIIIPRPSHPNIAVLGITDLKASQQTGKDKSAQEDYGKRFRETPSCNISADKDLGIGTSGEESSEGSWKERPLDSSSRAHGDTQLIRYPYFRSASHEEHSNPAFEEDETVQIERTPSAPSSRNSSRMSLYHIDNKTGHFNVRHSEEQPIRSSGERLSSVSRTRDSPLSSGIDQSKSAHEQQSQRPF
ncbi:patched domain-containing protein 3-like, partial [Limulus polyphemus]|uniref:Patched domain-containing protein 3-like n=1 Tax=Limulus polyphemus TaxID=6850 RepID=A0ABM1RV96_LIMPO